MPPWFSIVVSSLSGIVSILAICTFVIARRKEHAEAEARREAEIAQRERERAEDAAWRRTVENSLQELRRTSLEQGKRIDSHNGYAEMFARSPSAISELKENVAFIRGKLES